MNFSQALRSLVHLGHEFDVSSRLSQVSRDTPLFSSDRWQAQLVHDIDSVVSEMVKDRVEWILLLERTGRVFLPLLQAMYRKKWIPFPIWRSVEPGPNPFGHTYALEKLESLKNTFVGKGNIGVFDEYMVSGIRLKNTIVALREILDHPVHGYVLQHEKGSESPEVQIEIFSPGSRKSNLYMEVRDGFTNPLFIQRSGLHFSSPVSRDVYRRVMWGIVRRM